MKEFWNQKYRADEYVYGIEPNDFLKANIHHFPKGSKILCLAEGEGRNGVFLATQGFQVSAIDLSGAGKRKALTLAETLGVTIQYEVADLRDFDLGEEMWDGIVSISAHTSSSVRLGIFSKVKKALKKGGVFLLEGYNPKQLEYATGGPKDEDMLFSLEELTEEFSHFTLIIAQNHVREIHEGTFHSGTSSVVQFIAKK